MMRQLLLIILLLSTNITTVLSILQTNIIYVKSLLLSSILLSNDVHTNIHCNQYITQLNGIIGTGGTGTVYSASIKPIDGDISAIGVSKVSYPTTISSLTNECNILRRLETKHIDNYEKCVSICTTNDDNTMILKTPFFGYNAISGTNSDDIVSSIDSLSPDIARLAVRQLMKTISLSILVGGISSSDVQILINSKTGEFIVIDMSEARVIDNCNDTINSSDKALVLSYINEALTLVPERYNDDVRLGIDDALHDIKSKSLQINKQISALFLDRTQNI